MVSATPRRFVTLKRLLAVVAVYCVLWLLTFLIGGHQARLAAIRSCEAPLAGGRFIEVPYGTQGERGFSGQPVFACRVASYLPFIVRVQIDIYTGGDFAYGTSDWYFWFGVLRHRGRTMDWIT
jgi:hypothetical protein